MRTSQPAQRPATGVEIRIDRTPRRIRVFSAGLPLADSVDARLGYATGRHPEYLLPIADVAWDHASVDHAEFSDSEFSDSELGRYTPIRAAAGERENGRRYTGGPASGLASFEFGLMDAWYEEDEQIWFHPRDPFRRLDVIESSRLVEVTVNGHLVAWSRRPRLVTETGLPARWYLPRIDVDWTHLASSGTTSGCQYKGVATWWHVRQDGADHLADVAWGYERPVPEANKLAGLVAFYAEHAAVRTSVDGVIQPRPVIDRMAISPSLNLANAASETPSVQARPGSDRVRSRTPG